MKKILVFCAMALSLGFVSCGSDDDDSSTSNSSIKDLGNGIYEVNGHKFVDLGLPSGLLWAETNVGAVTAADYGGYYAWGETATKTDYSWSTYKWTSDGGSTFTKYTTDGKTVLDKEDDAAYVNWGSSCRMPTNDEFKELLNSSYCTWTLTEQTTSSGSSNKGYKVTSVKNGNSIFLPASGSRPSRDYYYGYWSSSLFPIRSRSARGLWLSSDRDRPVSDGVDRCYGLTVRPVAGK